MKIYTLSESLSVLPARTGQPWDRDRFWRLAFDQALRIVGVAPRLAAVIIKGTQVEDPQFVDPDSRQFAMLTKPMIYDLWHAHKTYSSLVAPQPGDQNYMAWDAVVARRFTLQWEKHTLESWAEAWPDSDWNDGPLMGEADLVQFARPVEVTDLSCRVPVETIEALVALSAQEAFPQSSALSNIAGISSGAFSSPTSRTYTSRRSSLDPVIDQAISAANCLDTGPVFIALRAFALDEVSPFTGIVNGDRLQYTNDMNEKVYLSKDALGKRLKGKRNTANAA